MIRFVIRLSRPFFCHSKRQKEKPKRCHFFPNFFLFSNFLHLHLAIIWKEQMSARGSLIRWKTDLEKTVILQNYERRGWQKALGGTHSFVPFVSFYLTCDEILIHSFIHEQQNEIMFDKSTTFLCWFLNHDMDGLDYQHCYLTLQIRRLELLLVRHCHHCQFN